MTSDKPGIVYVRRYASDAEEAVKILKKDSFVLNGMPPPPTGATWLVCRTPVVPS
ncbi:hypothetical protein DPMN_143841 [Dreissena polymorpha]|uniref:Uncharacterized protein n=1 Tax=Dreissena polymorpha TaxID=45954 RepID=A0A9D4GDT2_DREPO|nr:hypothetical protein DPMN_143841 [Dreissena polymorpha]